MHYFLDLDGTVTESRGAITQEMRDVLDRLESLAIVSGASKHQMHVQLRGLKYELMAQNGNDNELFQNRMSSRHEKEVLKHLSQFATILPDTLEERGCQTSFSFIGHRAAREKKLLFDPDGSHRQAILESFPLQSRLVDVRIGGTTCLDYFPKGGTKGQNIAKYIKMRKWDARDCLYIGDALFPLGNDESVVGVIPTFPVKGPADTLQFLS